MINFGFLDYPPSTRSLLVVRGSLLHSCPVSEVLNNSIVIPGKLAVAGATRNPGPPLYLPL
jgi:hypothetical protein